MHNLKIRVRFFKIILYTILIILWIGIDCAQSNQSEYITHKIGIFTFNLPDFVTKLSDEKLQNLIKQITQEAKKLATQSKTAYANQFEESNLTIFSAYATSNEDLIIMIYKDSEPVKADRNKMIDVNMQRINWGITSGYLSKTSQGITKLTVDMINCLLMDVNFQTGERLQTYTFFISEKIYGSMEYAIVIKTKNSTQFPYTDVIRYFINSLQIKLSLDNTKCVFKPVMTDEDLINCGAKSSY
jgi:hypothetical protein